MRHLLLTLPLLITQVTLIAAAPTFKFFDKTQLTPAQTTACSAFKSKSGQDRIAEAREILGIFPLSTTKTANGIEIDSDHPSFIMSRRNVIDLLGQPDNTDIATLNKIPNTNDKENISFLLGSQGGRASCLVINFENGHVTTVLIVTTKN